ncbi:MAG TPA: M4 family metallopeptidase [Jatrophihabitans sp.]|jgi:Zn-dependent metalloprotease|nr:M4 family metallopeptidase [Jatrophihabitans sp.]
MNSIFCILPPHILERIALNAPDRIREAALHTLAADATTRHVRMAEQFRMQAAPAAQRVQPLAPHKQRAIYTANNGTSLPGSLVRSEGQGATGDAAVDEAYDGLGATFDLYWSVFGRNSIDNAGQNLLGTVHYGQAYDNAFWNGSQMVFGDGDGQYFNRFTISIDVMGHELTHGVTGHQANLAYHDQPGALNESISDVFGSMVKQHAHAPQQTAASADWLIGAGLFTPAVNGVALRSMKAPGTAYDDKVLGKDPQPADMAHYVTTTSDNGGVHINSGIPNRAFYLAAVAMGGYSWDKAGRIWYATLCDPRLTSGAQFQDFANLTTDNAGLLFGSSEQEAVAEAWREVGINVGLPAMSGDWVLHYSWGSTTNYGQAPLTFNGDGSFSGAAAGQWRMRDGSLLLSFNTGPAKYAGTVDSNVGTGEMSTFSGLDGSWYLTRKGIVGIMEDLSGGALARQQPVDVAGGGW